MLEFNDFYNKLQKAYKNNASINQLKEILGKGRAKQGMFEGDLKEGELGIGQISAMIESVIPARKIVSDIVQGFFKEQEKINRIKF